MQKVKVKFNKYESLSKFITDGKIAFITVL